MVDFRKWLLALAAVGLLLGIGSSTANAQSNNPAFSCLPSPTNNIVRAEGIAELVGDMVLNCTGGTPTAAGSAIPESNVQITINTTVTSRIVSLGNVSEALMLIDDPYPPLADTFPPLTAIPTGHSATQTACLADNSTNCAITSPGNGFGAAGPYKGGAGFYNIFQGVQALSNGITWTGVPIDAPGTTYTRVIRITNIRGDANALGVASTLVPTQITMLVAVNGNTTLGSVNVTGTVATVEPGILTPPGATAIPGSYQVCNSVNTYLTTASEWGTVSPFAPPGSFVTDNGIGVTVTEGFAYAWRPQSFYQLYYVENGLSLGDYYAPDLTAFPYQNEPGVNYDTESGLTPFDSGVVEPTSAEEVGLADRGTRLQFAVAGVGAGVTLYAPSFMFLSGAYGPGIPVGVAVLVGTGSSGGAFPVSNNIPIGYSNGLFQVYTTATAQTTLATGAGGVPTAASPVAIATTGTSALLTYEIYYSNPSVQESLTVPIAVSYTANTATGIPAATTAPATVTVSFSPQNTTVFPAATTTTPIPRFGPSGSPVNLYSISSCACDLLFPFVSSADGFDTGIAIANTTADPFGTANQSGTITLNYYGSTANGGAAPPAATSGVISAGQELIFDLYSGGAGIAATPGFTGYIIAQANFQYCHGYAFISNLGLAPPGQFTEGYLAIVLNPAGPNAGVVRGLPPISEGESRGN